MCGIAGIVGTTRHQADLRPILCNLMHRGPDDSGTYSFEEASLGHAKLSIIDVDGGGQPITNEDGTICIVFNGEIYNHEKLRKYLRNEHTFQTRTDTEVILHLYEEVGERCIDMLDGMFVIAIYDIDHGLLLARDPVGIKPLYVSRKGDSIYFASEFKALQNHVKDFQEFPAGHCYTTANGLRRFFTVFDTGPCNTTVEDAEEQLRLRLDRAVRKRLMSDVPLGVFLSGGLDSSIITAIAAQYAPDLDTFSVSMAEGEDRKYAWMCAEHLGTRHHERIYDLDDMLTALPEVIYYLESYDAALVRSAIPNYFLAKLAAEHVKVALSGEGADELFSGYDYLKGLSHEDLNAELVEITQALHNTGLQRCDRMSMAHGLEARVPFLDVEMIRFAFSLPVEMKLGKDQTEKWILRRAFRHHLPDEIVYRRKSKFSEGAGSCGVLAEIAEDQISDTEFDRYIDSMGESVPRTKEELMYYRIFRLFYPSESAHKAIGFSRSL